MIRCVTLGHQSMHAITAGIFAILIAAPALAQLHAFYDFENGANDASGNNNHGTFVGNPLSSSGAGLYGNYAFENDGSANSYMWSDLQISPSIAPEVTIGAWVNVNDEAGYQTLIESNGWFGRKLAIDDRGLDAASTGNWSYSAFGGRTIGVAEDDWHVGRTRPLRDDTDYGTRSVIQGDTASSSDGWVFVATTYNSRLGETTLYTGDNKHKMVDSYPFNSVDDNRGGADGTSDFLHIGSISGQYENLNGRMDNVFVFKGTLSDSQMQALRTASDPLVTAQTISTELASRQRREWKIDFGPSGSFEFNDGQINWLPLTPVPTGVSGEETWNYINGGFNSGGSMFTSASNPGLISNNMRDTNGLGGQEGDPDFRVVYPEGSTVVTQTYAYGALGDPAAGDYLYWGVDGTDQSLQFAVDDLDPSKHYQITPIPGGVQDLYAQNNERRRFTMSMDTDGDGDTDTTRLIKMARGASISFVAAPDGDGTIRGIWGRGSEDNGEANLGGLIITEIDPADPNLKLSAAPIHRYSFDGTGTTVLQDTGSIGGAHGQTHATQGAPRQLDGSGKLKFDLSSGIGYASLPATVMDNLGSATIETWFTYTADPGRTDYFVESDPFNSDLYGFREDTPLFSFGDGGTEYIQQLAKGTTFDTPFTNDDPWFHEVQMNTDEAAQSNLFVGDSLWSQGNDYHVAITFDASAGADGRSILGYYLNGALVKQTLTDTLLEDIDFQNLFIGANQDLSSMIVMDYEEFRIYDYALTADEVLGNFILGADVQNFDPPPSYISGDFNGDDQVSGADLDILLQSWGDSSLPAGWIGDLLGEFDGTVSGNELDLLLQNWGNIAGGGNADFTFTESNYALARSLGISLPAVPEPTTLTLLGLSAAVLLIRHRSR